MVLRYSEDMSYDQWAERVSAYEYDIAKRSIARGEDIESVLETMARRIHSKMMHPVIIAMKVSATEK
jgi:glutamyl-tRNA reductase